MYTRLLTNLLVVYCIYFLSTLFHELNHKKYAKLYGLTLFESKKSLIQANQKEDLSKFSFFLFGIQFKLFGASVCIKNGEIEKLKFTQQKKIMLAGIKSDLVFTLILIMIYFILANLQLFELINLITNNINYIFSFSLLILIGKTFDNIFDIFNKGGDVRKLLSFKEKNAKE